VYDAIVEHVKAHQRPPTVRELGEILLIGSPNGVSDHLKALVKKGWITHDPMTSRGIRLR